MEPFIEMQCIVETCFKIGQNSKIRFRSAQSLRSSGMVDTLHGDYVVLKSNESTDDF